MRSVVITGMGVIAPGANSVTELRDLFSEARSSIRKVPGIAGEWHAGVVDISSLGAELSRSQQSNLDRTSLYALMAGEQALHDSGLMDDTRLSGAGIYVGCGGGGVHAIEENYRRLLTGDDVKSSALIKSMANAAASHMSIRWGIKGCNLTFSVACASSAIAIGEAWRAIRHGYLDIALAGGTETTLSEGVLRSWAAMRILARPDDATGVPRCRPFSANRSGLILGEGSAFFVLEAEESARSRGAVMHARIIGYASGADASHITAPSHHGQARTISAALSTAGIDKRMVGYVNAHGTGTYVGDISEVAALKVVFGDLLATLPVSSTKSAHGHLIGAAGALELLPAVFAVRDGLIAPTIHFDGPDPECPIDCVPNEARQVPTTRVALSNSFAFGGSNASLVVERIN